MTCEEYEREIDEREMDARLRKVDVGVFLLRVLKHLSNARQAGYHEAHSIVYELHEAHFFDTCPQYKLPEYGWKGEVGK